MRKLQRGGFSVQAEIDLHGMTLDEARPRLADFIEYSVSQGKYCVRVVHGKGLGSGDRGPVLKSAVNRWLQALGQCAGVRLHTAGRRGHRRNLRAATTTLKTIPYRIYLIYFLIIEPDDAYSGSRTCTHLQSA